MLAGVLTLSAQDRNFFPKPGYFRETLGSPNLHVELKPPTQIADFVVGGKLELSLRAYIELVMANNTDVALTRLNIGTATPARTLAAYGTFWTPSCHQNISGQVRRHSRCWRTKWRRQSRAKFFFA